MIRQGRLRQQRFKQNEVDETLQRAAEELAAARMLAQSHLESAFELAYNAMFLAGTAIMQHDGFRTAADGHHRTLVEYLEDRIGALDMGLVNDLDEARKRRNLTFYDRRRVTRRELSHILSAADAFVRFAAQLITDGRAQREPEKE